MWLKQGEALERNEGIRGTLGSWKVGETTYIHGGRWVGCWGCGGQEESWHLAGVPEGLQVPNWSALRAEASV